MAPIEPPSPAFPFKIKRFGKSPKTLFDNLQAIEIKGVFSGEKAPCGGGISSRRISFF
jgi:hypothetical protein